MTGRPRFIAASAALWLSLLSAAVPPGQAQTQAQPARVGDDAFVDPRELTLLGPRLIFNAYHPGISQALWSYEPGEGKVALLSQVRAGFRGASPGHLTAYAGSVFFAMDDGRAGPELWRTDGSAAGTRLVKDIQPGPEGSVPTSLTVFDGALFFSANDGAGGHRLWKTLGDAASTLPVAGAHELGNPGQLMVAGGRLFFTATDRDASRNSGRELWVMDAASAAPRLVKDIRPGPEDSTPSQLTAAGGLLFFTASDGAHGWELWKSDGSAAGTVLVKDIRPGPDASRPAYLVAHGRGVFFVADDGVHGVELWKSDGSAAGTTLVKDVRAGPAGSGASYLTVVDGAVYFTATDGEHGAELWRSDGSADGTWMVADLRAGADSALPNALARIGHRLLFAATDASGTARPWQSDGTAAGTRPLAGAGIATSPIAFVQLAGGGAAVVGKDGAGNDRLWIQDEAGGGLKLVGAVLEQRVR